MISKTVFWFWFKKVFFYVRDMKVISVFLWRLRLKKCFVFWKLKCFEKAINAISHVSLICFVFYIWCSN
jgi:hypothetical protein